MPILHVEDWRWSCAEACIVVDVSRGVPGWLTQTDQTFRMSEELIELLRQRVASRYYDQPQVIDVIARAILHSRGLYPS